MDSDRYYTKDSTVSTEPKSARGAHDARDTLQTVTHMLPISSVATAHDYRHSDYSKNTSPPDFAFTKAT